MLSKADNDLLTQVGPGTPMGNLMRQYWIPALMSTELPAPDCPPLRLRLLGENLIAFRTTSGEVGVIAERLPAPRRLDVLRAQRGGRAALRLPRLEVRRRPAPASTCLPSRPRATSRTRCAHVPTRREERNGVIWIYMGPRETPPALPRPGAEHAARRAQSSEAPARVQLAAVARRRHRHDPRRLPALRPCPGRGRGAALHGLLHAEAPRPQDDGRRHGVRRHLRLLPPGRGRHHLLAYRPLPLPVLRDAADRHPRRAHGGYRRRAGRRRALHALADQRSSRGHEPSVRQDRPGVCTAPRGGISARPGRLAG